MSNTVTTEDIRAYLLEFFNRPGDPSKMHIAKALRAVKPNTDLLRKHIEIMTMISIWIGLEDKYVVKLDDMLFYNPNTTISLNFLAEQVTQALAKKVVPMRR